MTQILNLPFLTFPVEVANNEDWADSWSYVDAASNPISLAGLTLVMMTRITAGDPTVQIVASSTAGAVSGLTQNGLVSAGGAGLNIVAVSVPRTTMTTLAPGEYVFEVQATGDGITRTIARGPLTVDEGVVR